MFARNAHLTDENEIKAKLDLAEFVKRGASRSPCPAVPDPFIVGRMADRLVLCGFDRFNRDRNVVLAQKVPNNAPALRSGLIPI